MADTDNTLYDRDGVPIRIGDMVSSKQRGGRHYGKVVDIVTTEEKGVKHPPKVLFHTQHGHLVQHNPGVLVHGEDPRGEEQPQKEGETTSGT